MSMTEIKRLRQERGDLIQNARNILDAAQKEGRELTAEEDEQFNSMHEAADNLKLQLEALERQAAAVRDERQKNAEGDLSRLAAMGVSLQNNRGTAVPANLGGMGGYKVSQEHINQAISAWCRKQYGLPLDDADNYSVELYRQYVDRKFSPDSRDLVTRFSNTFRWREMQNRMRAVHPSIRNDLSTGTGTGEAGVVIPEGFVARLEQAMLAFGGMLQTSEIMVTDSGNDMPWPTADDTFNKGAILSEASSIGSSVDPSFGAVILQAFKYSSKLVQVSAEILEDFAFDLPSILGSMLGERLGRILNEHFTTGTGSSQPRGIAVAATTGVTAASATAITSDEVIDLFHAVDPAYRPNAEFMMADSTVALVRKLKDSDNQYLWQPGLQAGIPDRLLGRVVNVNQDMPSAATGNKAILFGDLRKYKVRLAGQTRSRRLVERYADTDQEGFVSFIRADGDLVDAGTNPVQALEMA